MNRLDDELAVRLEDGRLRQDLERASREDLINFAMIVVRNYVKALKPVAPSTSEQEIT